MGYVYFYESIFSKQIYSYGFHIFKFNNLKVIHDLYSQCLTQTLSKTTFFMGTEGVPNWIITLPVFRARLRIFFKIIEKNIV